MWLFNTNSCVCGYCGHFKKYCPIAKIIKVQCMTEFINETFKMFITVYKSNKVILTLIDVQVNHKVLFVWVLKG